MTTLSTTHPTLLDLAKRTDPDGRISKLVELLNQQNPILDDIVFVEGNLPTGHRTTVRTGIPTPTWRKLYGGVQPTKSTTAQITDNTGMLEAYGEIDKALADLNGNTAEFRMSEEQGHREGLMQEVASTLFYGNEGSEPEAFTGLAPRFNDSTANNGDNIIKGGSSDTDNASIWLVVWGPNTVHGIIPKGSVAGLQMEDKGQVTIENINGNGGRMEAYRTHYRWDAGLTVRDWRYVVRIPNIEKSALKVDMTTGADISDLMFQAMEQVQDLTMGQPVFYMSRAIRTMWMRQSADKLKNSTLTYEQIGGIMVPTFHQIPVRRVDALAADEALVA